MTLSYVTVSWVHVPISIVMFSLSIPALCIITPLPFAPSHWPLFFLFCPTVRGAPQVPIPEEWRALLLQGISTHHAGLLPVFKSFVEELFAEALVKVGTTACLPSIR